jgi:hypothetical protein
MAEFESPTYILDLRDSLNCATLEGASPGEEIQVLVRPENDEASAPIRATGTLSSDSQTFQVVVTTSAGEQTHSWNYDTLKDALRARRKR